MANWFDKTWIGQIIEFEHPSCSWKVVEKLCTRAFIKRNLSRVNSTLNHAVFSSAKIPRIQLGLL